MTRDDVAEPSARSSPELADGELALLGEGSEHVVFAVDDRHVLSFARHEAPASAWLAPRVFAEQFARPEHLAAGLRALQRLRER